MFWNVELRIWICFRKKKNKRSFSNVDLRIWICFRKKFTRSFFECGIANMDMFSQKIYKKFFRMWNCEYGYVFAKIYKKFFEYGIANLLDVRMRNWRDIPNLEFVWTCVRIWNSHFLYVLSVELANMPDVFEYRTRKSRIPM